MARTKIALIGAGHDRRHARPPDRPEGAGRRRAVRHRRGHAAGQGARHRPIGRRRGLRLPLKGTNAYADIEGANVCIVTAGVPRKPGMSRDDLHRHQPQGHGAGRRRHQEVRARTPSSSVITNPLDAMVWALQKASGLPRNMVVGMAGVLDTARFRHFLAERVQRLGRGRVGLRARRPRRRHGAAGALLDRRRHPAARRRRAWAGSRQERLDQIVDRTRKGGGEIVGAPEDGLGLLRAGRVGDRDGRELTSRTRSACCRAPPTSTASTA